LKAVGGRVWLAGAAALGVAGCGGHEHDDDCTHLENFQEEFVAVRQGMNVQDVTGCSLQVVRALDRQIIDEMNCVIPDALVDFSDLNVTLGGTSTWALLQPSAKAGFRSAINARGRNFTVNSAYRTIAQQYLLYQWSQRGACGISIAAQPGRSNHQSGLAVDVSDYGGWRPHMEAHGWGWYGDGDPVHFDYEGGGTRDIRGTAILAFQRLWNRNNPNDRIDEDGAYGPQTEARLKRAPVAGFAQGASCAEPDPEPEPPQDAEVTLALGVESIEGQARDLVTGGSSAGIFDALEGQRVRLSAVVRQGAGVPTSDDVIVGYEVQGPNLAPKSYGIDSDWPARDGRTWSPNDANENPQNPSRTAPPAQGYVHLNAMSPGESKRVLFEVEAAAATEGELPWVRFWVKHVPNYYGEGDGWDDPVEVNLAPELLRREARLDVLSQDHWEWSGANEQDLEGWTPCGAGSLRVEGGALQLSDAGCAQSPPWTLIDANQYKALGLRVRHEAQNPVQFSVQWIPCQGAMSFDEECDEVVEVEGGALQELGLNIEGDPSWSGLVVGLRVEPLLGAAPGVELDAVYPLVSAPDPEPSNNGANNADNNANNNTPNNNGANNNGANNADTNNASNNTNSGSNNSNNSNNASNNDANSPNNGGAGNNGGGPIKDPNGQDDEPVLRTKSSQEGCSAAPGLGRGSAGWGGLFLGLAWGLLRLRRASHHDA
jgi:hypothetical protein